MSRFISITWVFMCLFCVTAAAQDVDSEFSYQQKRFVVSIPDLPANPDPDACSRGITYIERFGLFAIAPNYSGRFPLYQLFTRHETSRVKDNRSNQVGDILVCQDWQTYWPEENRVPVYYEITLGGRTYRAVGAGMSTRLPELGVLPGGAQVMLPEGYPSPEVNFINATATVLPAQEGRLGGIFYIANLGQEDDAVGVRYDRGSIGVLQVLVPQPYVEPVRHTYEYTGNTFEQVDDDSQVFSSADRVMAIFTIDCAKAHREATCENLPYRDYLRKGAVELSSIRFTAGPAELPTPDGRVMFQQFEFSTDADGRINAWDMDLYLQEPWINVDTDSRLDSAAFGDEGATVFGRPGTWRIVE